MKLSARSLTFVLFRAAGVRRTKGGLTLIELLITVAIMGVLAALSMSALGVARQAANAASAQSKLRQIFVATMNFAQENQNQLPRCAYSGEDGASNMYFFKMRENYVADYEDSALMPYLGGNKKSVEEMFKVPADPLKKSDGTQGRNFSFSFNFLINLRASSPSSMRQGLATIRTSNIVDPQLRAFIYEQECPDDGYCVWFIETPAKRYRGRSHVLFFDGHVELLGYDNVYSNFEMGDVITTDYQYY